MSSQATSGWPSEWRLARLTEVGSYHLGRTPPRKSPEYWTKTDGIPWVTITDMAPFSLVNQTAEVVSPRAASEIFQSPPVPKGTLLMSFKLTIGRTSVLGIDAYHNEAIISIRPRDGMDRDFLRFYLPTIDFTQHQDRAVKGQTLNRGKIDALPVPVPSLGEQRGIASILSKLLAVMEVQQRIVARLKELKAATMAKLFREGLRGEPLKQTEIGEIPESWDVVRLGDYCSISSGGTPSRDKAEYWNGHIPWVKTGEIDYRPITRTEEYITEAGLRDSSAKLFPKGTLLMAMYGQGVTRGKVAYLAIDAATNQACAALFPKEGLDSGYLYGYCAFAYDRIRGLGHGANQKNLSADLLREIRMPLPPSIEEQKRIYSTIQAIELRVHAAEARRDRLQGFFRSMLHLLMAGQVRVRMEAEMGREVIAPAQLGGGGVGSSVSVIPPGVEEFVAELVRRFAPERVVLFGQHVEGSPKAEREVGLLVVMAFEGRALAEAARIEREIEHEFALTVVVRRPEDVSRALAMGNAFIRGIVERGKVLYARPGAEVTAPTARSRTEGRRATPRRALSEETLREIVRRIVDAVAPEKIILFGSAARGEMGPDSDVDLLVVKSGVDRQETARTVRRRLLGIGIAKDVIVASPEDLSMYGGDRSRVISSALREGKVVYAT